MTLVPSFFYSLSYRRQREEFQCSESQVQLLGQGPLRAVTAGGRHHQDPLQERSQWLVERRGVRPGEGSANIHKFKKRNEEIVSRLFLSALLPFPGGLISSQLCGGGQLRLLLMWLQRTCVDPVCLDTSMYTTYSSVCVGSVSYLVSIALTHAHVWL